MNGNQPQTHSMTRVVERNIRALMSRREADEQRKTPEERIADAITRFAGSMMFVYLHGIVFGGWVVANLPFVPVKHFDADFVKLATFASVEAIFLSTFVLISQNRMMAQSDKRADLDLQVNLLSEHEVTRLVSLVTQMAQKMGIEESDDPELRELAQDVHPERVLDNIEAAEGQRQ